MSKSQSGIGIIEVMVALMLLAIAVLGFSAMQMTALQSTDESLMRTRALAIMRGGAETMRGHSLAIDEFETVLNANQTGDINATAVSAACRTTGGSVVSCDATALANKDALLLQQFARSQDITLGMADCPGNSERKCMIASWNDTDAEFGASPACANATTGVINAGENCFVMEAY